MNDGRGALPRRSRRRQSMEDLLKEDKYNDFVRNMLRGSNCGRVY